ncbi:MAG: cysteine dioxygenase family protein [Pirellulaceae bacterium]|nr:cysteine dioxygenase family protein [Pirellulaceae bacterium]
MLRGLVKLISHMDGLQRPPDMATLRRFLSEADVTPADMKVACKFNDVSYARTELAKSTWYQLLVICWRGGQSSPIHDHFGSLCGVRVVDGIATETLFEETRPGFVKPLAIHQYEKHSVCVTSDRDIHVVTNDQPKQDLITLHLYTPPLKMNFYEVDGRFDAS